MMKCYRH